MSMSINTAYPLPRGSAVPPPSPTCPECGNACEHDEVWPEDARPVLVMHESVVRRRLLALGHEGGIDLLSAIRDGASTLRQMKEATGLGASDLLADLRRAGLVKFSIFDGVVHNTVNREAIADLAAFVSSLGAGRVE